MVVLEERDYPVLPGCSPAESAVYAYCEGDGCLARRLVIPDLPDYLRLESSSIGLYIDPELAHLAAGLQAGKEPINPTLPGITSQDKICLWLTPALAARIRVEKMDSGLDDSAASTVCVSVTEGSDQIDFVVGEQVEVITNQPLAGLELASRVRVDPEWEGAHQAALYPEAEGTQVYYVAADSPDPTRTVRLLGSVYPDCPIGECQELSAYCASLSEDGCRRILERWGSCGICEDMTSWGRVCAGCQYLICQSCYCRIASPPRCPGCRGSGSALDAVGEVARHALRGPADVFRAIIKASPRARVLYEPDHDEFSWDDDETLSGAIALSLRDGEVIVRETDSADCVATHVIRWGVTQYDRQVRAPGPEPLQVYHIGPAWTTPFRAAAEARRLEDPEHLTVLPVVYRPRLSDLLSQYTSHISLKKTMVIESIVLHHEVVTTEGGYPDWDLEAIRHLVNVRMEQTHGGYDVLCEEDRAGWALVVDGVMVPQWTVLLLTIDDREVLNLTWLWCEVDPVNRIRDPPPSLLRE